MQKNIYLRIIFLWRLIFTVSFCFHTSPKLSSPFFHESEFGVRNIYVDEPYGAHVLMLPWAFTFPHFPVDLNLRIFVTQFDINQRLKYLYRNSKCKYFTDRMPVDQIYVATRYVPKHAHFSRQITLQLA